MKSFVIIGAVIFATATAEACPQTTVRNTQGQTTHVVTRPDAVTARIQDASGRTQAYVDSRSGRITDTSGRTQGYVVTRR